MTTPKKWQPTNLPSFRVKYPLNGNDQVLTIVSKKSTKPKAAYSTALHARFESNPTPTGSPPKKPIQIQFLNQVVYAIDSNGNYYECVVEDFVLDLSNFGMSNNHNQVTLLDDKMYIIGANEDNFPMQIGVDQTISCTVLNSDSTYREIESQVLNHVHGIDLSENTTGPYTQIDLMATYIKLRINIVNQL